MRLVGLDPGLEGYACLLDVDLTALVPARFAHSPRFWAAPVVTSPRVGKEFTYDRAGMVELAQEWRGLGVKAVALEEQQAFPGYGLKCPYCKKPKFQQGVAASFQLGVGFGTWLGAIEAAGIGLVIPRPSEWKGIMGLSSDKSKSVAVAQRLAPGIDFRPLERTKRARKPSHDKAESYLLARWLVGQVQREGA